MMKKFFAKKVVGDYILVGAGAFGLIALIMYLAYGVNDFNPNYSYLFIIIAIIGIVAAIASFIIRLRAFAFVTYLCFLAALIEYIVSQAAYIANLLYEGGIDGTPVTISFVMTIISCSIAFVAALVAGIINKKDFLSEKLLVQGKNTKSGR